MNYEVKENFRKEFQNLVGKKCWGIVEGKGTGSVITFCFGEKILREKPVGNENLSEEVQNFDSEFSVFVECVWRVDSEHEVIFGAWTEHEIVRREINKILNQTIDKIDLSEPAFDVKIIFSNGLQLKIFCDQTNKEDRNDNYSFFTPEVIYTVEYKSILTTSKPD